MVLVQKWPFSQLFFLKEYRPWKFLYGILEEKNAFLGYQNKKFKKSKYWHFSKGVNPWFWSKNGHFGNLFILGNVGQENVFYNILERENSFLDYKNKNFKKSKNWHFSKGVNPWFWSKNGHFGNLFILGNVGQENVFYNILERENAFLGYKNKKLKKSKNWHISKGFCPKLAIFSIFFFWQYRLGKSLLRYSTTIKRLSTL